MRNFRQIKTEFNLLGPRGTQDFLGEKYEIRYYDTTNLRIFKYFEGVLTSEQVKLYADIIISLSEWLEKGGLEEYVFVENPSEIGLDFIAIPSSDHVFFKATQVLYSGEKSQDVKNAYQQALAPIEQAYKKMEDKPKQMILKGIIERSILNPSWETYYNKKWNKIVVVEPNILIEDVLNWDS